MTAVGLPTARLRTVLWQGGCVCNPQAAHLFLRSGLIMATMTGEIKTTNSFLKFTNFWLCWVFVTVQGLSLVQQVLATL